MQVVKILLVFILAGVLACNKKEERMIVDYSNTIKEIVDTDPKFSMFKELYIYADSLAGYKEGSSTKAGLIGGSLGTRYITAFIPTNEAFAKNDITFIRNGATLNSKLIPFLSLNNRVALKASDISRFLLYYIYNKKLQANELKSDVGMLMVGFTTGDSLFIKQSGNSFFLNGIAGIDLSKVVERNNGVLYSVDNLITPPLLNSNFLTTIKSDTSLSLFVQAITRANNTQFNNSAAVASIYSTLFAPTNEAFRDIGLDEVTISQKTVAYLADLVNYHLHRNRIFLTDFTGGSIVMLNNQALNVSTTPELVVTNSSLGISGRIKTSNTVCLRAVVYKVDKVLKY